MQKATCLGRMGRGGGNVMMAEIFFQKIIILKINFWVL